MTALRQAVAKLQDGQREEAMIGLEFVLRLDPAFTPAVNLHQQLSSGAEEIDLGDIISQLHAPTTDTIDELLVEAVEEFNQRNFLEAKEKVERVLIELPGHGEARQLLGQVEDALKVENQVGQFLTQAREALSLGDPQEAANFVMMAQALDPHHSGIAPTLQEIYDTGGIQQQQTLEPAAEEPIAFETADGGSDDFAVQFDDADAALVEPATLEPAAIDLPPDAEPDLPAPDFAPPLGDPDPGAAWAPSTADDQILDSMESSAPDFSEQPAVPQPAEPPPSADDVAGLFDSEPESAPEPPRAPAPDDISDLFEAEPQRPGDQDMEGEIPAERRSVQSLLQRGDEAFERGELLVAIDSWSRVYLFETADQGVSDRIEQARMQLEEVDRRVDHLLFEATDASLAGQQERAGELIDEVLSLQPENQKALELRGQLAAPVETGPDGARVATHEMPDLDDDLFDEKEEIAAPADDFAEPILPPDEIPDRRILGLPIRTAAMIGGGLAVVLIVLVVFFGGFLGGSGKDGGDVYGLRDRTEALYREGNSKEALRLVREFTSSDPDDQVVLDRLLERYQRALATPTPSPIPASLSAARNLYGCGLWFHAYAEALGGLRRFPDDPALAEIKTQIDNDESMAAVLHTAVAGENYHTAAGISRDLLLVYSRQPDLEEVLDRSLFNAALAEMRTYNLTGAEVVLRELDQRHPGDEVVERILEFIVKYKARPVDMTLKVFIASLEKRRRQKLECETRDSLPTSTPTAVPTETPEAEPG